MIKSNVIGGIIFLAIGASFFIYNAYAFPPLRTAFDKDRIIHANSYWRFENGVKSGRKVYSEYSTSDEIEFFILDSENFELFLKKYKEGERYIFFSAIYHSFGNSDSYTFRAPKDDTYYTILLNDGDNDVSASFKQLERMYYIVNAAGVLSLFLVLGGFIALIVGLIQKPKTVETNKKTGYNEASLVHENQRVG